MASNQRTHHVDQPRHLLLEDLVGDEALLPQPGGLLEVLHNVLRSVLVSASAKVGEHLQLLGSEHLVLQRVVPVVARTGISRGLCHEKPRFHVSDCHLLDEALQSLWGFVLQQDDRAHHCGPKAKEVVFRVWHHLPSPEAVHGKAVDLLDPRLKLLVSAELVELVRGVDLAQQSAKLVVAIVVLQTHLGGQDGCRALHHAGQQPRSIFFLLKEGTPKSCKQNQELQAELSALCPLIGAAPGEHVEEQLGDAIVPQHVPAVGDHDRALLVRRIIGDGAHEVEGQAIAGEVQHLLCQPPLVTLIRHVDGAGAQLLQRLDGDGEDRRQRGVPEAEGSPPVPAHGRPD
mmetsp:Transcript_37224/g.88905  ORF Transcript_37224/g.88905 Transcript_37224/m.88905 type:complete len:344 (+) Transcript_37224:1823-2854(+)